MASMHINGFYTHITNTWLTLAFRLAHSLASSIALGRIQGNLWLQCQYFD